MRSLFLAALLLDEYARHATTDRNAVGPCVLDIDMPVVSDESRVEIVATEFLVDLVATQGPCGRGAELAARARRDGCVRDRIVEHVVLSEFVDALAGRRRALRGCKRAQAGETHRAEEARHELMIAKFPPVS